MTASILPPPRTIFLDSNGNPLAGGSVSTYIPGTTTQKQTWQDEAQTILNTNPVILDEAGGAIIWGSGSYRWIVEDSNGNLIYDQVTTDNSQVVLNQTSTGDFYENFGANIDRMNDRVFIGAATVNDGDFPGTTKDWLETLIPATTSVSQEACLSTIGGLAITGGSRASDGGSTGRAGMGVAGFAYNDSTDPAKPTTWAVYGEARRVANATGITQATEFDIINYSGGSAGYIDPYDISNDVTTINLWASNGRPDVASSDATVALGIVNNSATTTSGRYHTGICFHSTSILGTDGLGTGIGPAIALARGHQILWYNGFNSQAGGIVSDVATSSLAQFIAFSDSGVSFTQGNAGPITFQVGQSGSVTANYLQVLPAPSGFGVALKALGTDPNVDLRLFCQGDGRVDFVTTGTSTSANAGSSSALPATPLGYLTIKVNGTNVKIPYYNP